MISKALSYKRTFQQTQTRSLAIITGIGILVAVIVLATANLAPLYLILFNLAFHML